MANPNQSVRTCMLKVDLKCCTGCQKKASMKLQSISGVNEVEYNSEKGLMTVTGDVEPMALVRKLTKCGRKTELFSVKYQLDDDDLNSDDKEDTSSDSTRTYPDPKTMKREIQEKMEQKKNTGLLKKPSLLGCFSSKSKVVQPLLMRNLNWHIPSKFGNGPPAFGFPFANATTSSQLRPLHPMMPYPPMMQQQPPPMMQQQPPTMMQQQPQVPRTGTAMPYNVNMFQPPPMMQQQPPPMIQQQPPPMMQQQPPPMMQQQPPPMMQQQPPPKMQQQPPPKMQQQPPPMMQQQPHVPMTGAAIPYNVNMFQP